MKKPNRELLATTATTMLHRTPKAATRVRKPRIRPMPPRNSAIMARNANTSGMWAPCVKPAITFENPGPPKSPNVFCRPCGRIMMPAASLSTVRYQSLRVANNARNISLTLLQLRLFQERRRHFTRGVVLASHLVVQFLHRSVAEFAGELGQRFAQPGDTLQRLPANGDRDLIRGKGVLVVAQNGQTAPGQEAVSGIGGDHVHLAIRQGLVEQTEV